MSAMPLYSSEHHTNKNLNVDGKTLASFEGGGSRAIISARLCQEIEECTREPIVDLFTCFAGTSAGAIVALALNFPESPGSTRPKHSAQQVVHFIKENAEKIFPPAGYWNRFCSLFTSKYNPKGLYDVLDDKFGNVFLSDSIKDIIIPVANLSKTTEPWFFTKSGIIRNTMEPLISDEGFRKVLMADVLKGTCSAPYFFPYWTFNIDNQPYNFMDGGTFANNPVSIGISHARGIFDPCSSLLVGSFGTGCPIPKNNLPCTYNSGALYWLFNYPNTSMQLNNAEAHLQATCQLSYQSKNQLKFFQFQPIIKEEDYTLDDSSPAHLERLLNATEVYIDEHKPQIKQFCDGLKKSRTANPNTT